MRQASSVPPASTIMMATSPSPSVIVQRPTGHDQLEGRLVAVLVGGVGDPLAVGGVGDADGADGAVEGDAGEHQGGRGAVDGQHVVRVLLVGAEDGAHDVDLVAEALGERGPQGPVEQAAGEDGLVGGPALPAEERAGDLAGGVHPLLDVDGEGEEVDSLPDAAGGGGGAEHHGVAQLGQHRAVGQLRQLAGLEGHGLVGPTDGGRNGNGFRHVCRSLSRVRSATASSQLSATRTACRPGELATGS